MEEIFVYKAQSGNRRVVLIFDFSIFFEKFARSLEKTNSRKIFRRKTVWSTLYIQLEIDIFLFIFHKMSQTVVLLSRKELYRHVVIEIICI